MPLSNFCFALGRCIQGELISAFAHVLNRTANAGCLTHMEAPPDNDYCSVCHDSFTLPCQANCAHWFCGKLCIGTLSLVISLFEKI